jgi:hypothetical protein
VRRLAILFVLLTAVAAATAQDKATEAKPKKQLMLPPMYKGGIAGLWEKEHLFVKSQFGEFELLNFDNTTHRIKVDTMTDKTWQLVAMGNYLEKGLQFATLARVKDKPEGMLLIMFEWKEPAEGSDAHGVFYHQFVGKQDLLLRTKQGGGGKLDTLELSCTDVQRVCGKCYYNTDKGRVELQTIDTDAAPAETKK